MFLVELIISSFLDLISKQARQNAAVSVFLFFKDSNHSLEYMSFLGLPQHDCNFNFYPEGVSVFVTFRHLRIWVGQSEH